MMRNVQIAELDSVRDKINEGGKPFCVTTLFPFLDWSVFAIEEKVGKYITRRFKTMMKESDHFELESCESHDPTSRDCMTFGSGQMEKSNGQF